MTCSQPTAEDKANHPCPPFKLIILDESDTMTTDAQAALRRIIEAHSKITRFVLICNYVTRIIAPLASRCAKFRFKALDPAEMKARLGDISRGEAVAVSEEVVDTIIETSGGDMRRAVQTLQSTCTFSAEPTPEDVYEMSGIVPAKVLGPVVAACKTGTFEPMQAAVTDMMVSGYPAAEVLKTLSALVLKEPSLRDVDKADVSIALAGAGKNLADGADEELQVMDVAAKLVRAFRDSKAAQAA
ncbi:hypothetical protein TeGR_g6249 [Tetraparma gracilis]|uniref:Replication factor C C-terminal domain-containing protein n=1 Tax=Tetraparma gracilis TaxID=2962635 RepID=A0ABQ6M971_9STRA|nr:hypothetical protein TeGR_g6249 [Tetraparma gracilis]